MITVISTRVPIVSRVPSFVDSIKAPQNLSQIHPIPQHVKNDYLSICSVVLDRWFAKIASLFVPLMNLRAATKVFVAVSQV